MHIDTNKKKCDTKNDTDNISPCEIKGKEKSTDKEICTDYCYINEKISEEKKQKKRSTG